MHHPAEILVTRLENSKEWQAIELSLEYQVAAYLFGNDFVPAAAKSKGQVHYDERYHQIEEWFHQKEKRFDKEIHHRLRRDGQPESERCRRNENAEGEIQKIGEGKCWFGVLKFFIVYG